jgi:hypothetical protein
MSKIEVNTVDVQCGSTLTLGSSGKTVTLATGASQSGFGREGSVNWQTGSIKTSTFTAASGEGYFVDTSSGAVTANLPAGSAGAIVAFSDYTRTFNTNNLTIAPNGSNKIGGVGQSTKLNVNGQSATFVFVDATEGWINVQETQTSVKGISPFIEASGGTETESGDFKIHTFTGPGTFTVTGAGVPGLPAPTSSTTVDYLVIGGGGGGAGGTAYNSGSTGGGGAGGYRESSGAVSGCYARSPLGACVSALPVSIQGYPITVGAGAAAQVCSGPNCSTPGIRGSDSIFSTITSAAGGGGKAATPNATSTGGSGGGGNYQCSSGGAGNTPPVSPPQGNTGGAGSPSGPPYASGGGGGAGAVGGAYAPGTSGTGGAGVASSITASPVTRAGGGGGGGSNTINRGMGGSGGGGAGGSPSDLAGDGTANTGGGGGAANTNPHPSPVTTTGAGGSGIVVIRYRFQ